MAPVPHGSSRLWEERESSSWDLWPKWASLANRSLHQHCTPVALHQAVSGPGLALPVGLCGDLGGQGDSVGWVTMDRLTEVEMSWAEDSIREGQGLCVTQMQMLGRPDAVLCIGCFQEGAAF